MSDTAAFLAGCAVTGVAVLFVMRNDGLGQTKGPPSLQSPLPTPEMSATPFSSPSSSGWSQEDGRSFRMETQLDQQRDLSRDLSSQLRNQQDRTDDLKSQLERQQRQTEDLKGQLEKQERNTDVLIAQIQEQQRLLERLSDKPISTPMPIDALTERQAPNNNSQIQTIITGAIGIIVLVVVTGGGLILFAIIVVVLAASNRRRPARTVHVVHPFPRPYTTLPSQPMLPTRSSRSARHIDVEYYTDEGYE